MFACISNTTAFQQGWPFIQQQRLRSSFHTTERTQFCITTVHVITWVFTA